MPRRHPLSPPDADPGDVPEGPVPRLIAGVLGALLLLLALLIAARLLDDAPWWAWPLIVAMGLLGAEGLLSAFTGRRSLLLRLGTFVP